MLSILKDGHVADLQAHRTAGGLLSHESDSHVLQCAQLPSISNQSSAVVEMSGHTFTSPKTHRSGPEAWRMSAVVGLVCVVLRPLCWCAERILRGCPSAPCLVWRGGLAVASQP